MRLARRDFVILVGLSAIDVVLETQGYGVVTLVFKTASRILENGLKLVSPDATAGIKDRVCAFFAAPLRPYLRSVRIATSNGARTAYADNSGDREPLIVVSSDFFNTARESRYWRDYYSKPPYDMSPEQPVFSEDFRIQLLAHEMLHIAQARVQVEPARFYDQVAQWYQDESCGRPCQGGVTGGIAESNYTKFVLWWNVYGHPGNSDVETDTDWKRMDYCERYLQSPRGVEEFAYVGETILLPANAANRVTRLNEISDGMHDFYIGVIDPAILDLRSAHS